MRIAPETLRAYHNVCPHRGRRLIDIPAGARNARGTKANFICGFHGWTFDLQGMKNIGFLGTQPNTYMERSIVSLHRNLATYMRTGIPVPIS